MNRPHLVIALLAVGVAAPAWSQKVDPFGVPAGCDPSKGHCVSTIVFSSTCDEPLACLRRAEIYRISTDDHGTPLEDTLLRLTENEIGVNGFFAGNVFAKLSPDGKRIVFDSNRDRAAGEPINTSDLFWMKADGKDQTNLTRGSSATWSPNGKYIAFHRSASGAPCPPAPRPPGIPGCPIRIDPGAATWDSDIFIMRVPDTEDGPVEAPINITNTLNYIEEDADWSPDGQKIVFTRHHPDTKSLNNSPDAEICVLDLETPDAGAACRLGPDDNNFEEERAPAWSPDGTHVAYMCRKGQPANPPLPSFEICVMKADGTDPTRLTFNSVFDGTPTWSPHGLNSPDGETVQKILFTRGATNVAQLWLMNADGNDQTLLEIPALPPNTGVVNLFASWGQLWVGGRGRH